MKILRIISIVSRILVGLVFIFSGFVKLVDPLGSTYKFVDYFNAFHMGFLESSSIYLATIMSLAEFIIGVSLLIGLRMRLAAWAVLIFMSFFTILTFFLALFNPVTDCGCFGDALVITNWQTFGKNLIIIVFVIIIFIYRNKYKPFLSGKSEWMVVGVFVIFGAWFTHYCYNHLPVIDFRPYKVGTSIPDGMIIPESQKNNVDQYETTLLYKKNGVVKEFSLKNIPDSTWQWVETKNVLIKEGYHPPIHNFSITNQEGSEITDIVLNDSNYTFLLISYNLKKANKSQTSRINEIAGWSQANGVGFKCITGSSFKDVEAFKKETKAMYEFFNVDEITVKTMIRSNPGLMLMKNGTILAMWHYNDLPDAKKLNKNLLSYITNEARAKSEHFFVYNFIIFFLLLISIVCTFGLYIKYRSLKRD